MSTFGVLIIKLTLLYAAAETDIEQLPILNN